MELIWESIKEAVSLIFSFDAEIMQTVGRSLSVTGVAVLISVLIGIPFGMLLGLRRFRGRGFLATLVNTGLGMPPVVVGLAVYMVLSRSGPLGPLRLLFSPSAMVIAQVFLAAPYITAITMSAVGSVPKELRLQAMGLGASRLQSFWVLFREARVSLLAAVIAGFGAAISEVGAVMMVGGNIAGQTSVMTTSIVEETTKGNFENAMALGVFLLLIVFLLNVLLTHYQQGLKGRWLSS